MTVVYWQDRNGNFAPQGAVFQCRPFFPNCTVPFVKTDRQIARLPAPDTVKVIRRTFLPDREEWIRKVKIALTEKMEKIVLARSEILEFEHPPDPFAITAMLKEKSYGSYIFCFSNETHSFLGASPERLFQREDHLLASEAMAGTCPISASSLKLLSSQKDFRELLPVQTFLKNALSPICLTPPVFSPITIHSTQNVHHLYSPCRAILRLKVSNNEILDRIHPTPALCGTPGDKAFDLIRKLEPFERGLYGGALGWSTFSESEWIVGIRSCLIHKNRACLYAGTGIVEGSDPEAEWEELNQKSKVFEPVFK